MVQPGRKLRVAVDARELNRPHLRGMGKYLLELIRHSKVAQSIEWQLFSDRPDLPFHQPREAGVSVRITDVPGYRIHAWEQCYLPIMAAGADILHCPFSRAPWLQLRPTVVTIHDTIPWESKRTVMGPRLLRRHASASRVQESASRHYRIAGVPVGHFEALARD
jgi:alpha-1,3-rhamnosyl/mannosyltransferase